MAVNRTRSAHTDPHRPQDNFWRILWEGLAAIAFVLIHSALDFLVHWTNQDNRWWAPFMLAVLEVCSISLITGTAVAEAIVGLRRLLRLLFPGLSDLVSRLAELWLRKKLLSIRQELLDVERRSIAVQQELEEVQQRIDMLRAGGQASEPLSVHEDQWPSTGTLGGEVEAGHPE